MVHAKRATRDISRGREWEDKMVFGRNVQSGGSVIAAVPLISLVESLVGASTCLHSMLCARSSRTRPPTLRSSAHRPFPLLTPVAATATETSKPHHACSAKRADQVTYRGDQDRVGVCNFSKRSHNVSPCCGGSSPPNAQNLKHEAAGAFRGGREVDRGCGPSLRIQI